jgi:Mn-containing catalase
MLPDSASLPGTEAARRAHAEHLNDAFELHLAETEIRVECLNEILEFLDESTAQPKPCRGMMGLTDEGGEVMTEN